LVVLHTNRSKSCRRDTVRRLVNNKNSVLDKKSRVTNRALTVDKLDESVIDAIIDPCLIWFTDEAWFHLNGYVSSLNNWYWRHP
ncbi:hypothetical protein C0J52_21923, partial [Blattella germanica]